MSATRAYLFVIEYKHCINKTLLYPSSNNVVENSFNGGDGEAKGYQSESFIHWRLETMGSQQERVYFPVESILQF
jgi:hypothetical protein